jgi:hypothetical protein
MSDVTYTLNIEPVGDHLEVFIPEIDTRLVTKGTALTEAVDAAHRAIIVYLTEKGGPGATTKQISVKS